VSQLDSVAPEVRVGSTGAIITAKQEGNQTKDSPAYARDSDGV
jgi:hypothetical protein